MIIYSFAKRGDAFGRSVYTVNATSGLHFTKTLTFMTLHERLKNVMIENLDFRQVFKDYSHPDTVFYCDPPYLNTLRTNYFGNAFNRKDHEDLLECIFKSQSFVALSGHENDLYDAYPWDNKFTWEQYRSIKCVDDSEGEEDADLKNKRDVAHKTEVLWIKERK